MVLVKIIVGIKNKLSHSNIKIFQACTSFRHLRAHQICATRVFFFLLFSCNFYDQLSPGFPRFVSICMLGYTKWEYRSLTITNSVQYLKKGSNGQCQPLIVHFNFVFFLQTSDISRVSLYISVLDSVCTFMVRSLGVSGCVAGVIRNGRTRLLDCCLLLLTQGTECRAVSDKSFSLSWPSGLEHRIQFLLVKSSECGFESRSWHLCSLAKYFTKIASLYQGYKWVPARVEVDIVY